LQGDVSREVSRIEGGGGSGGAAAALGQYVPSLNLNMPETGMMMKEVEKAMF